MKVMFVFFFFIGMAYGRELLINGDFEKGLDTGWQNIIFNAECCKYDRQKSLDTTDNDFEFIIRSATEVLYPASARFFQKVKVNDMKFENMIFSVRAKFNRCLEAGSCQSGFIVQFKDTIMKRLGDIKIIQRGSYDAAFQWPVDSNQVLHLIDITNMYFWNQFSYNIGEELKSIPALKTSDIAYVEVSIIAASNCVPLRKR